MKSLAATFFLALFSIHSNYAQGTSPGPQALTTVAPTAVGMSPTHLTYLDSAIESEISRQQLPGAVVIVGRQGKIVYRRAYGNKALEPRPEPMTVDTIFDLASLTKVVATATSVMILIERGQIRLADPVTRYIPGIWRDGQEEYHGRTPAGSPLRADCRQSG
ncbi:MAG: beta-lactamase family protein [Acidobacteria bacterium]|nr:beta-lactamase family protein [Acidobacteriota bacterium]